MASHPESSSSKIDRDTTTPFHLKLFYRQNSFHHLSDYPIPSPSTPSPSLPAHVQIYTWYSCTLRELAHLLTSCLPELAVGSRLNFRLIYPDAKVHLGGFGSSGAGGPGPTDEVRGRYLSKDVGSVIVAPKSTASDDAPSATKTTLEGEDADRTLQDVRFIIGDYVECAISPPLADGSVPPPVSSRGPPGGSGVGGGMRAFPSVRENGFGRNRTQGGGMGRSSGPLPGIPSGDWRRGERVPDNGRGGYGGSNFRSRGRPY